MTGLGSDTEVGCMRMGTGLAGQLCRSEEGSVPRSRHWSWVGSGVVGGGILAKGRMGGDGWTGSEVVARGGCISAAWKLAGTKLRLRERLRVRADGGEAS